MIILTCQHGPARRRMLRKMQRPLWLRFILGALRFLGISACIALFLFALLLGVSLLGDPVGAPVQVVYRSTV
jgi:hypothetical protein